MLKNRNPVSSKDHKEARSGRQIPEGVRATGERRPIPAKMTGTDRRKKIEPKGQDKEIEGGVVLPHETSPVAEGGQ